MPLQLPPEGTRTPRSGSARAKDEKRGRTKLPQGHTGDVSRYSPAAYRSQRVAVGEKIHSGAATTVAFPGSSTTAEADKSPQEGAASKNPDSKTDAERTTEGAPMEVGENTALAKNQSGSSFLTRYTDAKRPDLFEKADIVGFSPRLGFKYDEKMKLDYWKQETAYVVRSLDNCTSFSTTNATVGINSAAGAASAESVNNRSKKLLPDVSREKEFLSRTTPHKLRNFDVFEPDSALNFHSEKNVNFRSDMMKSGIASVRNAVSPTKTLVSSTSHNINLLTGAPTAAAGTMRLRLQGGPKPRTDGLPSNVPLVSGGGGGAGTALLSGLGASSYSLGRKAPESRGLMNTTTAHQRQNTAPTTPGSNVGIAVPSMRGCIAAAANAGASKSATPSNASNKGCTSGKQRTVGTAQGTKVLLNQNTSRLKSPKVVNVPNNTRGGINHDRSLPVFSPSEQGLLQTLDDLKATNAANLSKAKSESDILLGYAPVDSGYFDVVGGVGQNHQHPGNKQLQQQQQEQHYTTLAANTTLTVPSKQHLPGGRSAATTPTTAVPSPAEEEGGNGVRDEAAATDNNPCVVQKNNLQVVAGVKKTRLKSPAAPATTSPASSTAVSSPAAKTMLNKARNDVTTAARINNERTIVSKNAVVTTTTKATSSSSSSLSTAKQDLSSIRAVVGAPPLSARRVGAKTNDGGGVTARRGGAGETRSALGKNAISTKGNNPTASIAARSQKVGTAATSSSNVGAHASSSTAGHGPLQSKQGAAPKSANAKAGPGTEGSFSGNTRAKTKLVSTSSPRRTGAVVPTRGASGTAKSSATAAALKSEATRLAPPVRPEKKAVASRSPTRNGINKQRNTVTKDANQLNNVAGVSRRPPETQPITGSRGVMGAAKAPKKAAAPTSLKKASLNGEKPKKVTTEEGFTTDTTRISTSHRTKNKPAVPTFRPSSRVTETTSSTTVETNKPTTSALRRRGNVPFASSSSTRSLAGKKSPRQPHPQFVELEAPPAVPNERVLERVEFLPAAVPPDEEGDPQEDRLQDREVAQDPPEHQVQTDPNINEVDDRMLSANEKSFSLLSLSKENITLEQSHLQQEDEPDDSQLQELLQDDLMRNIEDRIQQLDPDEEDTPRPFMAVEEKIGEEVDVEKIVVPTDQSVEEHNQNVNRDVLLSSRLSTSRESAMLSFRQSSTSVQPPDRGRETDNSDSDNSDNQVD